MLLRRINRPTTLSLVIAQKSIRRQTSKIANPSEKVSFHYGDHNPGVKSYYALIGGTIAISVLITMYRYRTKGMDDVGLKQNVNKLKSEYRTVNTFVVEAWPNIECALTVIYGYEICSNIAKTLSALKFYEQSFVNSSERPELISKKVNKVENELKNILSKLVMDTPNMNALSVKALESLKVLNDALNEDKSVPWGVIEEKFSTVDWHKETPLVDHLNHDYKEETIKKAKHLSYESNLLEREIEKYLVTASPTS